MTRQNLLNPVLEQPSARSSFSALETQFVDERMMRSIQQNYQVSHQQEFLKLRIQAEALLLELRKFARNPSEEAEFTL